MAETEHKRAGPAPLDRLIIGSKTEKVKDLLDRTCRRRVTVTIFH